MNFNRETRRWNRSVQYYIGMLFQFPDKSNSGFIIRTADIRLVDMITSPEMKLNRWMPADDGQQYRTVNIPSCKIPGKSYADGITGFAGNMVFVYFHVLLFGGWILANLGYCSRREARAWIDDGEALAFSALLPAVPRQSRPT